MNLILTAGPEKGRWYPQAAERRGRGNRRTGGDRRGGGRRASTDLWRELGRPGLLELRSSAERRSGVERRRTGDRRHSRVAYVTAWQLPER